MVKVPMLGRVKTRLGRDVGGVCATSFYRHCLRAIVARTARDPRWQTTLAIAPAAEMHSRALPVVFARSPQGHGDLGVRMHRQFKSAPPGKVVIVGTDVPGITPARVASAFRSLGSRPVVLGPAPDGGYWLVGVRKTPSLPRLFERVRWSTEHTLQDTVANAGADQVALVDTLWDVDSGAELARCRAWFGRVVLPTAVSSRSSPY